MNKDAKKYMNKIIANNALGYSVRKELLETLFDCHIPTKIIKDGVKGFMVSWSVVSYVPQKILDFCTDNAIEISTSTMNEDIFFKRL